MRTFFIYNYFELYSVDADFWEKGKHRHQFYELLYIEKGTGVHTLNSNEHKYSGGDIYLLTPGDQHSFLTLEPTKFHCIRFLPELFPDVASSIQEVLSRLKDLLKSHNLLEGKISLKPEDQDFLLVLIKRILTESKNQAKQDELIIRHCLILGLEVIYKHLLKDLNNSETILSNQLHIDSMIIYIRQHIANSKKLTKKAIAAYFNISPYYVGEYFKKHTGISFREYIRAYKLSIIEKKIKQSKLSFGQIGQDLGFTDESHFYKFLKMHTKKSPTEYKEALAQ